MLNPNVLLLFATAIAHLFLGMLVLVKNRKSKLNLLVFFLSASAASWCLAVMLVISHHQYAPLLFWIRASHAVAIIIPWSIFAVAVAFAGKESMKRNSYWLLFIGFCALALAILSFTPYIVRDLEMPIANKEIAVGSLFYIYTAFFFGVILSALRILYLQLQVSKGLIRLQLRYLFWGITVSLLMGSLANLLLPLAGFKALDLRSFGPAFSIVMIGSICYAIVKYRLMDIRLFVRNGLAVGITASLFSMIFWLAYNFISLLDLYILFNLATLLAAVLIVALLFAPLQSRVQKTIDKLFFRGVYDYHSSLLKSGKAMVSLLSLNKLIAHLAHNLVEKMQLESCYFFMPNKEGDMLLAYSLCADDQKAPPEVKIIPVEDPVISVIKLNSDLLLVTDVLNTLSQDYMESLNQTFKFINSEAVLPVTLDRELEGIFFLGPKLSGEPYTKEDNNLLQLLLNQLTVAWRNAQLYQEVLEIKQHLENVLANMGSALIAINGEGVVTLFNSAAERLTGLKMENLIGKKADDILNNGLGDLLQMALVDKRDIKEAEQVYRQNGRELHLSCNISLVGMGETQDRGAIMLLNDITRIKELQREKDQALRFASLGEVAAGMAHEIKNPLVSIKTFAELLPEKYNDPEFRFAFSGIVIQEIERINTLIKQLQDLTADPVYYFKMTRLEDIMDEVLLLLSPYLESCRIRLTKSYETGIPAANIDRNHFKQALFNICLNSAQAMQDGGDLVVALTCSKLKQGSSRKPANADEIKILVKDTGIGIPWDIKHRIFDPFFTTKADGMGMGLSLSHKIVVAHGGTIVFNSDSTGTVFEVKLPVCS